MDENNKRSVSFLGTRHVLDIGEDITVLEAARLAGVFFDSPCSGNGTCGKCKAIIQGPVSPADDTEKELLSPAEIDQGVRLACRTLIQGNITVAVPSEGHRTAEPVPEKIDIKSEAGSFGAALDLGTTNMAVSLVNLHSGHEVAITGCLNPQVAYGHDVLTRVHYASRTAGGTEQMQRAAVEAVNKTIGDLCGRNGISKADIREVTVAANTCMLHIFAGVDPYPLGRAPYRSVFNEGRTIGSAGIGLDIAPEGDVYLLPSISPFVGSDISAGLAATEFYRKTGPALFADLGTNGEMAVIADGRIAVCSTAAGPAFEGMNISCGCRAEPGAIDRVSLGHDGRIQIHTVDGKPASGICGTGLIDLTAALLSAGAIEASGRLSGALANGEGKTRRYIAAGDSPDSREIALTQSDIRQVQLAKAAVVTGIGLLLDSLGLRDSDLTEVYIAGAFGYHLNPSSLARIGVLSKTMSERFTFVGNSSLAGAKLALTSKEFRGELEEMRSQVDTVDLASHPEFEQRFVKAMTFPGK
ncbi:MAG: ASKHA domain-containing protein [Actinomycetota bacterium]